MVHRYYHIIDYISYALEKGKFNQFGSGVVRRYTGWTEVRHLKKRRCHWGPNQAIIHLFVHLIFSTILSSEQTDRLYLVMKTVGFNKYVSILEGKLCQVNLCNKGDTYAET